MGRLGLLVRVVAATLVVFVLAGCEATVGTVIDVQALDDTEVAVELVLDGDAAAAVADPVITEQVKATFERRLGQRPEVTTDGSTLRFHTPVPFARLVGNGTVTGIADAAITEGPDPDTATVSVRFTDPSELRAAVQAAVAEAAPGTDVPVSELLRVGLTVQFPGDVHGVGGDVEAFVTARAVKVAVPIGNAAALDGKTLTVTGSLADTDTSGSIPWPLVAVGVVVAVAVAFAVNRID